MTFPKFPFDLLGIDDVVNPPNEKKKCLRVRSQLNDNKRFFFSFPSLYFMGNSVNEPDEILVLDQFFCRNTFCLSAYLVGISHLAMMAASVARKIMEAI